MESLISAGALSCVFPADVGDSCVVSKGEKTAEGEYSEEDHWELPLSPRGVKGTAVDAIECGLLNELCDDKSD